MAAIIRSQVVLTAAATIRDSTSMSSAGGFCRRSGFLVSVKRLAASHGHAAAFDGVRASASTSSSTSEPAATGEKLTGLEGIKLYDPTGAAVSLVGLWESRSAVIAFARHFGCDLCRKRADLLQSRKAEMDAAGVALVLIAPGIPEQAREFVEQTNFAGEVYADPDRASYDALEFVNGVRSTLNRKSGARIVQAVNEGYRQGWQSTFYQDTVQRGGWQQGGILVAGPGVDTVCFLFKDKEAGDEPALDDVISACCSI